MQPSYLPAALLKAVTSDAGQKVYTFKATSNIVDRQKEIVTADGWETDNYLRNPIVLDSHNLTTIEAVIGRTVELRPVVDGMEADIIFAGTPRGQMAQQLVEEGMLRAVSVGFFPRETKAAQSRGEPVQYTRKELFEISTCSVPVNPDALRLRALDAADEPMTKAGRVLSATNESRLRQAAGLLADVLAGLTPNESDHAPAVAAGVTAMNEDLAALLSATAATLKGLD